MAAADLTTLKAQVEEVLRDAPDGIIAGSFWNDFTKKHNFLPIPKKYNVTKRSDLLELCSSVFERDGSGNNARLRLKAHSSGYRDCRVETCVATATAHSADNKLATKKETGIEGAVAQLELEQSNMQQRSSAASSFYDQFYSAQKPAQENSHQLASDSQRVEGSRVSSSQQFASRISTPLHQMMPNTGMAVHVPSLLDIKPNVLPGHGGSQQSYSATHRGFYQPLMFTASQQPGVSNQPLVVTQSQQLGRSQYPRTATPGRDGLSGSRDPSLTRSSATGMQQSVSNIVFHGNLTRPSNNTEVSFNQSSAKVPASGGRKMNFNRSQINSAAEDCIERLSAAKDFVSLEKIEKLLLQHFEVESLHQLHLNRVEELQCVNEHVRLLCKVNTYIQNFVKVSLHCFCDNHESEDSFH
jgi:hypothetical protein